MVEEEKSKPKCLGRVNDSEEFLKLKGIQKERDCKTCDYLTECVSVYNQKAYDHWSFDEENELEKPGDEMFLEDDGDWDPQEDDPE